MIWLLSPYWLNIIDIELVDLLHMLLDVVCKSVYGACKLVCVCVCVRALSTASISQHYWLCIVSSSSVHYRAVGVIMRGSPLHNLEHRS